jgi:hypothetical protein
MSQLITLHSGTAAYTGLKRLCTSIKLACRALSERSASSRWLQLLNSHPMFMDLVKAKPQLVYKIYRPYLSKKFSCDQRVDLLGAHYRLILGHGLAALTLRAARASVPLGAVEGKSGVAYEVRLSAVDHMEREGDLALQLLRGGEPVYTCAFSFFALALDTPGQSGYGVFVGCMQGPRDARGLELIREATRELHGLRPKNLMVRLLARIGHDFGCAELRLVGNDNRAAWRAARQGKVHADYDALWTELGAQRRTDGDHTLPCGAPAEPDLALVPSKKRSEVRKRHETLTRLADAVCAGLRERQ